MRSLARSGISSEPMRCTGGPALSLSPLGPDQMTRDANMYVMQFNDGNRRLLKKVVQSQYEDEIEGDVIDREFR